MVELNRTYLYQRATILSLLVMMLPGCATQRIVEWPSIEGQVLEENTDKPLEGAIIVALWKGTAPYTTSVCFHVESTTTDDEGRYVIPAWRNEDKWNNLDGQYVSIYAYKTGYEHVRSNGSFANIYTERVIKFDGYTWLEDQGRTNKYLKAFSNSNSERLKYLKSYVPKMACPSGGESNAKRYDIYRALYDEANSLAATKKEQEAVYSLLRRVEQYDLGVDEARAKYIQRLERLRDTQ